MLFPKLKNIPTSKDMLDVFKGYNHNLRIGEGEFYEMTNLSSDDFPVLSTRCKRGVYHSPGSENDVPRGLASKDSLCYIDGKNFVIGDTTIDMDLSIDDKPKSIVSSGANVCIFPDKKYVNMATFDAEHPDTLEYGDIQKTFQVDVLDGIEDGKRVYFNGPVLLYYRRADGTQYTTVREGSYEPNDPIDGMLWIILERNFSSSASDFPRPMGAKEYSKSDEEWKIVEPYVEIYSERLIHDCVVGDFVLVSGFDDKDDTGDRRYLLNGISPVYDAGDNYIVVNGLFSGFAVSRNYVQLFSYDVKSVKFKRLMPLLDFVIASGNRLWGCRYGKNLIGDTVNEIYTSELGNFGKWTAFDGVSTDSFVASVGSDGPFTGAIEYRGNPIFFKENCMHIVYGDYTGAFQIKTVNCRGVQRGCERSLAILNEKLYYKSKDGICVFDGSLPVDISEALGSVSYKDAAAGVLKDKYYISMRDSDDKWHMFVYDSSKGIWHREDDTHATCFCSHDGDLYYIDYADNSIKTVKGTVGALESTPLKWEAVSGILGTSSPDKKYISRLDVRMMLDVGSTVTFYAEYDSSGSWDHLFTMTGRPELRSFTVPVRPKRCDHLRLKISGIGEAKIFSICKTFETGSGD